LIRLNLPLKYPDFGPRIKNEKGKTYILDLVRKKWLILSPEEWVRQHLLNYLIEVKRYPASSISIEKELQLNDLRKRYDVVVYNKQLKPYLIVECKAPYIELNKAVVEQALRYNLIVKAPYLMITNGVSDLVFNSKNEITELSDYLTA